MNLRNRSKNLKEKLIKHDEEKEAKKGGGGDKRFLNYFDLEDGEKMTIRLLPDGGDSGEYWSEYDSHNIRGMDAVRCSYESNGESCDICNHSYQYYLEGEKDNNTKWMGKTKFIAQCIVIDAPFEVNGHDDENENIIKLFSMPRGVWEIIKEAVIEDRVGEIMDTDFVLKNVMKKGKKGGKSYNNYDRSYFAKDEDPLDEGIINAIDSGNIDLFDFSEIVPEATTSEEMTEWLEQAIEVDDKTSRKSTTSSKSSDEKSVDDDDDKESSGKKTSAKSLLEKLKKKDNNKE